MCLLLRMNQRRSDSFWMLKARRTASVWLANLSLYQTADQMFFFCSVYFHVIAAQTYQLKSGMLPIKCTVFNGFYFSVTIVATTISLFILQTHKIPGKGCIITRRQHMKPYTLSSQSSLMHSSGRLNINMAIATKQRSLHTLWHMSSK